MSARKYSSGGLYNYNNRIRSMTVSSDPSPMAYVLSDNKIIDASTSLLLCNG
jgi:hypothetical protein